MLKRTCPECNGNGTKECDCCGAETYCKNCEGEGLIDVEGDYNYFTLKAVMKIQGNKIRMIYKKSKADLEAYKAHQAYREKKPINIFLRRV